MDKQTVWRRMESSDEEKYWEGLLGALAEGPSTSHISTVEIGHEIDEEKEVKIGKKIQQKHSENYNETFPPHLRKQQHSSKLVDVASPFVDVDLEDEKQYYYKFYSEYFASADQCKTDADGVTNFDTVDVWSEGKNSTPYNFVTMSESQERDITCENETENQNNLSQLSTSLNSEHERKCGDDVSVRENSFIPSSFISPLSILSQYVPRFMNLDRTLNSLQFTFRSKFSKSSGNQKSLISLAFDTALFAKERALDQITSYFRSNIYISSFLGCVSESVIFASDRVKTASARYLNQLTADDPEQIHLERIKNSTKWNHIFLRYSMATLSWKERQLIEETQNDGLMQDLKQAALPNDKEFRQLLEAASTLEQQGEELHVSLEAEAEATGTDGISSLDEESAAHYALSRFFTAPPFEEKAVCAACYRPFSLALFRHHCRNCGRSFCDEHSKSRRCIFRFGLVQPVRVCTKCCGTIDEVHRRDCLVWKECRVNAYLTDRLIPYFNPLIDRGIDKAMRVADYSIIVARNTLTLNYPTKIVLETVDILKRYGLAGFAGLLLRKDFMDSVETLKRISGMDTMFSTSIHELTACIYYKLAIERGIRGCNVDKEFIDHGRKGTQFPVDPDSEHEVSAGTGTGTGAQSSSFTEQKSSNLGNEATVQCETTSNEDLSEVIRLAPLALKIAYERSSVDCQRLARLLGWETLFSNADESSVLQVEHPCYALLATSHRLLSNPPKGKQVRREAVLAIRGTQTIQDVVTDIRAIPEEFCPSQAALKAALQGLPLPRQRFRQSVDEEEVDVDGGAMEAEEEEEEDDGSSLVSSEDEDESEVIQQWEFLQGGSSTAVDESGVPISLKKYACGGMSRAAMNLLREVGPSLVKLHLAGYSIKLVGHSLGGAVAAMLTYLLMSVEGGKGKGKGALGSGFKAMDVRCITYGCPSCVDATIADMLAENGRVTSVVLHDDVICRITPQSIRLMMQELMYFRQQVFHHIKQDWSDVVSRSMSLWSPRTREDRPGFGTVESGSSKITTASVSVAAAASDLDSLQPLSVTGGQALEAASPSAAELASPSFEEVEAAKQGEADGEVLVQDIALLDLWIPGRIIHIFSHNGQYRACTVSRNFPDIRRVVLQCNMFEDHRSKNILDALLAVKAVREADRTNGKGGPRLVPFDASEACQCCNNSFTWHSTFRGQAQEYRERYNCKCCGGLVCGPCSTNKRAMPGFGFIFPRRICDSCLYNCDYSNMYTV